VTAPNRFIGSGKAVVDGRKHQKLGARLSAKYSLSRTARPLGYRPIAKWFAIVHLRQQIRCFLGKRP
jgi:hypothetical protein